MLSDSILGPYQNLSAMLLRLVKLFIRAFQMLETFLTAMVNSKDLLQNALIYHWTVDRMGVHTSSPWTWGFSRNLTSNTPKKGWTHKLAFVFLDVLDFLFCWVSKRFKPKKGWTVVGHFVCYYIACQKSQNWLEPVRVEFGEKGRNTCSCCWILSCLLSSNSLLQIGGKSGIQAEHHACHSRRATRTNCWT